MGGIIKEAFEALVEAFNDGSTEPYGPDNRENAGDTIEALIDILPGEPPEGLGEKMVEDAHSWAHRSIHGFERIDREAIGDPTLPDPSPDPSQDPTDVPTPPAPPTPPVPRRDPLAFDLNGDGSVETLSRDEGVFFDLDNSGFAEQTSWVASSDGFLVLDRNGNGQIDGGAELFGTETMLASGEYAENGYEALAEFDINVDGKIDAGDIAFSGLRVWQDANSDGISDADELHTLEELGIASINVGYESNEFTDTNNVEHREQSTFTYADGRSGLSNTLWFDSDHRNSVPVDIHNGSGIEIPDDIAGLPDAVGFGNAYSLHQAMALDETGQLKVLVEAFVAEADPASRKELIGDILAVWTGQQDVDPTSRGNAVNGRELGVLETFWGQPALQENPSGQYAQVVADVYEGLERSVYTQLMADSHADQLFNLLSFTEQDGELVGDFSAAGAHFATRFANGDVTAGQDLEDFIDVVGGVSPYDSVMEDSFIAELEIQASDLGPQAKRAVLETIRKGNGTHEGTEGDDILEGFDGNDVLKGHDGDDNLHGGDGQDQIYGGDGEDLIDGGRGNDRLYGGNDDDFLVGGLGQDYLYGDGGDDILIGGADQDYLFGGDGNDLLISSGSGDYLNGGSGNDVYLYAAGDGNITINNYDTGADRYDVLRFDDENIVPAGVATARSGNNLLLTIGTTGDVVTVQSYFHQDGNGGYALNEVIFTDGTVWDLDTLKTLVQQGTEGNDQLYGYADTDTLEGLGGNDTIYGGGGNDTLSGGDGNDNVHGQGGDDVVYGNAGDDRLYGQDGRDLLIGGDGRDSLYGGNGNDFLRGGAGNNDYLDGEAGSDTYLFAAGDGNTTIDNYDLGENSRDTLNFLGDIQASDVRVTRSGNNLFLTLQSTGEVITVQNFFLRSEYELDAVQFTDGTVWDLDTLKTLVQQGTEGNDQLYGYADTDTLEGLGGNDTIYGGGGNDTLSGGDGNDNVQGQDGDDVVYGNAGDDRLYGQDGRDLLIGGDGRDSLYGGNGNDFLRGGAGNNDYLDGEAGSDTYLFAAGDGNTTIDNYDLGENSRDTLNFLGDIQASDVRVTRSGNNLFLTLQSTGEVITVQNFFLRSEYELDAVQFTDGTVWDLDTLKTLVQQGTEGNDQLYGYAEADTLDGLGGNDTIYGGGGDDTLHGGDGNDNVQGQDGDDVVYGDAGDDRLYGQDGRDLLIGGDGRDSLYGGSGNDFLRGGAGINDYLSGDAGNDAYLFATGDGNTTIDNYDLGENSRDTLNFLGDIQASDVRVTRSGNNLFLTLQSTGEVITVQNFFLRSEYELDAVQFTDGTAWDTNTLRSLALGATESNDNITGYDTDDVIDSLGGNDNLYGGTGDDTLHGGDGNDNVQGQDGDDAVFGDAGDDRLYGQNGNDTLNGGDGRDRLYGGNGNDVLRGGAGTNDYLDGEAGSDTYLFAAGDGNTTIDNYDRSANSHDTLRFMAGVESSDVRATRSGNSLYLRLQSTGEVITVQNFFLRSDYELDAVEFTDGTVWDLDTLKTLVQQGSEGNDQLYGYADTDTLEGLGGNDTIYGGGGNDILSGGDGNDNVYGQDGDDVVFGDAGDDRLYGQNGNDTLNGGDGRDRLYGGNGNDVLRGGAGTNDYLYGEAGSDTYLFAAGDGNTTIDNYDRSANSHDTLRFMAGVESSDVRATRSGNSLYLRLQSTGEVITVQNFFLRSDYELDAVEFTDGTVWDLDTLKTLVQQGSEGNDQLYGYADTDTLAGLGGNDTIYGGGGNDILSGGDGNDNVYGQDGDDIVFGDAGDDRLYGQNGNDTLNGGDGRDSLYGGNGNDILRGGAGDGDYLRGEAGSDTYLFAAGDGNTTIDNYDRSANSHDTLRFMAGVESSDVRATRSGNSLYLRLQSTGEVITVQNFFLRSDYELDAVEFTDGTVWDLDTLKTLVQQGSEGNDQLYGYADTDTLEGLGGNDTIYGGGGNDILSGGDGNDNVYGQDGDDVVFGDAGDDRLYGQNGNDTLNGGDGRDSLYGGNGNDILRGGAGDGDYLRGEAGSDTYVFGAGSGADSIDNYDTNAASTDVARFEDVSIEDLWFSRSGSSLQITVAGTDDRVTINSWYSNANYQLDEIQVGDSVLLNSQVEQLVSAMAAYDVPVGAGNVIPQETKDELQTVLAASWQNS